jgi:hypothetical protein
MRVLVILVLLVGVARADDQTEARKAFTAGQAADKKKDWAKAIEHYQKANELVPHPFAMYNIAVDYEHLGQLREAATWYEKYLDNVGTKEADRERVNRLLIDLRNKPGKISVTSNPDGARVIINGVPTGTTPYNGELKGGMYHVQVQRGDDRDFKEVTIEYGEPLEVEFTLPGATEKPTVRPPVAPPTKTTATTTNAGTTNGGTTPEPRRPVTTRPANGTLVVRGEPYGALVAVDNVPIGTLPIQLPLEAGQHNIRITAEGYANFEQDVQIAPNQPTPVDARLARSLDSLTPTSSGGGIKVAYILGGGAGTDARGNGNMYLFEAGLRSSKYDLSARVGKLIDVTAVDLLFRWAFLKSRVAPFVGGGYSYVKDGYGYVLVGGFRFDIANGDKVGLSLMAESGYRFYSGSLSSSGGDTTATTSGSIVPLMASLLLSYR